MTIEVGGVNLVEGVLDAQYKVAVLEKLVQHLAKQMPPGTMSQADIDRYQEEALEEMQKRYPDAGIKRK